MKWNKKWCRREVKGEERDGKLLTGGWERKAKGRYRGREVCSCTLSKTGFLHACQQDTPSTQPSCHCSRSGSWPRSAEDFCVSSAMAVLIAASNNHAKCISLWNVSSICINLWFL